MPEYERLDGNSGCMASWRAFTAMEKKLTILTVILEIVIFALALALATHKCHEPDPITTVPPTISTSTSSVKPTSSSTKSTSTVTPSPTNSTSSSSSSVTPSTTKGTTSSTSSVTPSPTNSTSSSSSSSSVTPTTTKPSSSTKSTNTTL
nr:PREDICTED: bypass of stop codon protein 1 isoform X3 [Tribolium castaneum]|eukprot:XP_015833822.1 PREDICTED: bypass of stop codon protein 1 isoform X3 [Tribolium castaneum]